LFPPFPLLFFFHQRSLFSHNWLYPFRLLCIGMTRLSAFSLFQRDIRFFLIERCFSSDREDVPPPASLINEPRSLDLSFFRSVPFGPLLNRDRQIPSPSWLFPRNPPVSPASIHSYTNAAFLAALANAAGFSQEQFSFPSIVQFTSVHVLLA